MRNLAWLALLIPFAFSTEDLDARMCTDVGGVVVRDELPHQKPIFRCLVGGKTVRAWTHGSEDNVLIWGY